MPTFPSAGITIPDSVTLEQLPKLLRQMLVAQNRNLASVQREQLGDPKRTDRREAISLYTRSGPVFLETAVQPKPGQVLYAVNEKQAAWGDSASPAPTDPGSGPNVGAPHNLLDGVQDQDTLAASVTRGAMIYGNATPKWAKLAAPGAASVLTHDATDVAWTAKVATRSVLIPAKTFDTSGATAAYNVVGTPPDFYECWEFPVTGTADISTIFRVPYDYLSGAVSVTVHWATTGATNTNWVPKVVELALAVSTAFTAAGSTITGPATSCNFAADVMQSTVAGTFTPGGGAGSLVRIGVRRVPGGSDTYLGTIRVAALEIDYTAAY